MMRTKTVRMVLSGCLVLKFAGAAWAGESAPATAPAPAATLASLSWMAGSWGGRQGGTEMEEHWTAAGGRVMLGMHRDIFPSGKSFFEFLRIEERAGGLVYVAMPGGAGTTEFRMKEIGPARVVFENPQHDFPQRIIYWTGEDRRLHARVEGPSKTGERSEEWAWERLPAAR
jgi:hypothetical protein